MEEMGAHRFDEQDEGVRVVSRSWEFIGRSILTFTFGVQLSSKGLRIKVKDGGEGCTFVSSRRSLKYEPLEPQDIKIIHFVWSQKMGRVRGILALRIFYNYRRGGVRGTCEHFAVLLDINFHSRVRGNCLRRCRC